MLSVPGLSLAQAAAPAPQLPAAATPAVRLPAVIVTATKDKPAPAKVPAEPKPLHLPRPQDIGRPLLSGPVVGNLRLDELQSSKELDRRYLSPLKATWFW